MAEDVWTQSSDHYDRIIADLWDDKEKIFYGATPMFMIRAVK
jgi:hypothetical protein